MNSTSSTLNGCPLISSDGQPLVHWIANFTGSCIYSHQAALSWTFGYISVIAWLGAQLPQIIENHKNKSVEGLSLGFLANWFLGDFTNFVGSLLTGQMPFQIVLAGYYLCVDLVLTGQLYYYTKLQKLHRMHKSHSHHHFKVVSNDHVAIETTKPLSIPATARSSSFNNLRSLVTSSFLASFSKVRAAPIPVSAPSSTASVATAGNAISVLFASSHTIGTVISWFCACCYLTSRLPQIYKNYKRKSTSGTSIMLFLAALTGNTTYSLSILLAPPPLGQTKSQFLLNELPFLLGAAGTVIFDLTIFVQWLVYSDEQEENFLPTTPHFHYHHANNANGSIINGYKYDLIDDSCISDLEDDADVLEGIAQASSSLESDSRSKLRKVASIPLKSQPNEDEETLETVTLMPKSSSQNYGSV